MQSVANAQDLHVGGGISSKALLSSITRLVTDNERLQKDNDEKVRQGSDRAPCEAR